jgi:L-lactate utilization protein LutC
LVPQLRRGSRTPLEDSLPYASSLCGACYEVCPVKINIPKILVRLRSEIVDEKRAEHPRNPELLTMKVIETGLSSSNLFQSTIRVGGLIARVKRSKKIHRLPPPFNKWSAARDAPVPPSESFRSWFTKTHPGTMKSEAIMKLPAPNELAAERRNPFNKKKPATDSPGTGVGHGRSVVLASINVALGETRTGTALSRERHYRTHGNMLIDEKMELLRDRLVDYRASVTETTESEIASRVNELLRRRGSSSVVVANDFPSEWLSGATVVVHADDPTLSTAQLDAIDSTITGCSVAIAETGTIVLDSGQLQGRRALSLVPDHLIVIIRENQVVELVPEAIARLRPNAAQTWISGPSATSDIELERIEGVHGPRTLDVVFVRS